MMTDSQIVKGYELAKELYAAYGVDVDEAIRQADSVPLSLNCWQGMMSSALMGRTPSPGASPPPATTPAAPGRRRN